MNGIVRLCIGAAAVFILVVRTAWAAEPAAGAAATPPAMAGTDATTPWPAEIKGFEAVKGGEHPRLFFRKGDLPKLRERAKTPEGQAILKRLRWLLNGGDGETPTPKERWTISSVAGYGFLYQITGDKKYADLARQVQDLAYDKTTHDCKDPRYGFSCPDGALRAGPAIGWGTLGYDLCYDGWDEAYRRKFAEYIQDYNAGSSRTLPELARGARHGPGSNHWGMQIGGAAMAMLGIMNDPGVDMARLGPLMEQNKKAMICKLTEGYGDGGYYNEGDGTGSMGNIAFLPAIQAWRVAGGLDYYTPRPNAQWMALRWFHLTVPIPGNVKVSEGFYPQRGMYPHNVWSAVHAYFAVGFGVATEEQRAAVLWFYNHSGVKEAYDKGGGPYDTMSVCPHVAILSFVNWPVGQDEKNPQGIIPNACRDTKYGFYAWRNRWQDENDTVIGILSFLSRGQQKDHHPEVIAIRSQGQNRTWGQIRGRFTGEYAPAKDGSTILTTGDGSCLALDFSRASGAEVMLVMTGPSAPNDLVVEAGGTRFSFLFLGKGEAPTPKVVGGKVVVGQQTVSVEKGRIVLSVFGK